MAVRDSSEARASDSAEALRFRSGADWFVAGRLAGVYTARIGATGERAVDLMFALVNRLEDDVDVALESVRDDAAWRGVALNVSIVRDAIARLRLPLTTYGGVELAIYTPDDQLTLTSELEVVVYSRSPRWYALLQSAGLEERDSAPPPIWRPSRRQLVDAPELRAVLEAIVNRLGLTPTPPDTVGPS